MKIHEMLQVKCHHLTMSEAAWASETIRSMVWQKIAANPDGAVGHQDGAGEQLRSLPWLVKREVPSEEQEALLRRFVNNGLRSLRGDEEITSNSEAEYSFEESGQDGDANSDAGDFQVDAASNGGTSIIAAGERFFADAADAEWDE